MFRPFCQQNILARIGMVAICGLDTVWSQTTHKTELKKIVVLKKSILERGNLGLKVNKKTS